MAAAYVALVSLSHSLQHILNPPPLNKISIDRQQIESLRGKVDFFIDFLETYNPSGRSQEIADLETKIADAAYKAEDIIETNVVEQIHCNRQTNEKYSTLLYEGIQTLLKKFVLAEKELLVIKDKEGGEKTLQLTNSTVLCKCIRTVQEKFLSIEKELVKMRDVQSEGDLQPKRSAIATSTRSLPRGNNAMVGFKEHETQIMEALGTNDSKLQLVPIVGMGGIGKTTLAKSVYNNPSIVHYFAIRAWVTVSQEFAVGDLLLHLLSDITNSDVDKKDRSDDEIGELLYKELFDRKYLIVMDDVWDIQAWKKVTRFLPRNTNGSRILLTTRLSDLAANAFGNCRPFEIGLLDKENSWDLLHGQVFGKEHCPIELEEIGKSIARKCGGLPLALVVIGGLLAKSETTKEHWEFVEADVPSAINYGNDEHLMDILSLSYTHLPIYLRPCFLYLAMFPEDSEIRVPPLLRLWVAEGLIRQTPNKCLEEVAHEYLEDLINRNLLMVHKRGSSGNVRSCKIHDLVRELCIKEAEKENFVYIAKLDSTNISPKIETKRRLSVSSTGKLEVTVIEALQSARFNRSWLSHGKLLRYSEQVDGHIGVSSEEKKLVKKTMHGFLLLKVVHVQDLEPSINILNLINLRYLVTSSVRCISSISVCWNLQTLVVRGHRITLPVEFWQMPQLRHLKMGDGVVTIPDPPPYYEKVTILKNLQTLKGVQDFKFTKEVTERIPNLKMLGIAYHQTYDSRYVTEHLKDGDYCLKNLVYFTKLGSVKIKRGGEVLRDMVLPVSLKKLSIRDCGIPWEYFSVIALLPNLEVLKLWPNATKGEVWNPIEGQFCRLKYLLIWGGELKEWQADYTHFPCLEQLVLGNVKLETIPESFAQMSTLEVIELYDKIGSIWKSATEISKIRQDELGFDPLVIRSYYDWVPPPHIIS